MTEHRLEYRPAKRPGLLARAWCTGCTWAASGTRLTEQLARENHALHVENIREAERVGH